MKFIECTMTVQFKYKLDDSRDQYDNPDDGIHSDDQILALDKEAVEENDISMWDLDPDGKITYEWRITDDA